MQPRRVTQGEGSPTGNFNFFLKSARLTYDVPGIAKSLIIPISAPAVVTRPLSNLTIEKIEFAGNFLNFISLLQILKQS